MKRWPGRLAAGPRTGVGLLDGIRGIFGASERNSGSLGKAAIVGEREDKDGGFCGAERSRAGFGGFLVGVMVGEFGVFAKLATADSVGSLGDGWEFCTTIGDRHWGDFRTQFTQWKPIPTNSNFQEFRNVGTKIMRPR